MCIVEYFAFVAEYIVRNRFFPSWCIFVRLL